MKISKRKLRHIIELVRCLLFRSKVPKVYLVDACLTSLYTINRLLFSNDKNKSAFELLFNRFPDYNHLRVFGTLCYPLLPKFSLKFL